MTSPDYIAGEIGGVVSQWKILLKIDFHHGMS